MKMLKQLARKLACWKFIGRFTLRMLEVTQWQS